MTIKDGDCASIAYLDMNFGKMNAEMKKKTREDLLKYCVSLNAETLKEAGLSGRMQYEKFHSSKNLPGMLMESARHRQTPNALKPFSVQSDEWALWMERQLTVSRVFSRGVYRALRRLRAWW